MAPVKLFPVPGFLQGLLKRDLNWEPWMKGIWTMEPGYTGKEVSQSTALQNSAFFACTRIIAETTATLPMVTFKSLQPRGRAKAEEHPLYPIFHDDPNPEMTDVEFKEAVVGHMIRWGNAYINTQYDHPGPKFGPGSGPWLWPLRPDRMQVTRRRSDNKLAYVYTLPTGEQRALDPTQVWHLKAFGDGTMGWSVLALARHSLELGMAAEEYGARLFGNMSAPGGVLTTDKSLTDKALNRMKRDWEDFHKGLTMSHRVAILEEGVKWQQVTVPPEDAQFLQTRSYQNIDFARFLRIPPHMIAELDRATFSNIEHQGLEFVIYTLLPWLTRIEKSAKKQFLRDPYYVKFNVLALLRGDQKTRYEAYNTGLQGGFLCPDDIRELEDMNPMGSEKGGDIFRFPVNNVPSDMAREYAETLVSKATAAATQAGDSGSSTEKNGKRSLERRDWGRERDELAETHHKLIHDAATRVVRREVKDIARLADKTLRVRDAVDFEDACADYYTDYQATVRQIMAAPMQVLAEAAAKVAAAEVEAKPDYRVVADFCNQYLDSFCSNYARKSMNQIRDVVASAVIAGVDPRAALQTRLDEWAEKRATKMSDKETRKLVNSVARESWIRAGVQSVKWNAGSRACAYCRSLDGRTVGIQKAFLEEGDYTPDTVTVPMKIRTKIQHPPAHGGCHCRIDPA